MPTVKTVPTLPSSPITIRLSNAARLDVLRTTGTLPPAVQRIQSIAVPIDAMVTVWGQLHADGVSLVGIPDDRTERDEWGFVPTDTDVLISRTIAHGAWLAQREQDALDQQRRQATAAGSQLGRMVVALCCPDDVNGYGYPLAEIVDAYHRHLREAAEATQTMATQLRRAVVARAITLCGQHHSSEVSQQVTVRVRRTRPPAHHCAVHHNPPRRAPSATRHRRLSAAPGRLGHAPGRLRGVIPPRSRWGSIPAGT